MYFDDNTLEFNKVLNLLLPFCQTNLGKQRALEIKPTNELDLINQMLNEVECAYDASVKYGDLPLGSFKDVKNPVMRAQIGGVLSPDELVDISGTLYCARNILKYFQDLGNNKINFSALNDYVSNIKAIKKLEDDINSMISPDLRINDNASMELFKIRRKLKMEETHLRNYMNSMLSSKASMLQENLIASRDGHLTLPVRAEYKNQIKGIVRDSSSSGTTYYIEPDEAYKISVLIEQIKVDEKNEEQQILRSLSLIIASNAEQILLNLKNIVALDLIFAKAKYALNHNMVKPNINDEGIIDIKAGAHPLIDDSIVVKNDVKLGIDYDTIIITGPNTGGKTVLLKMVGLITLMMQSGMFVPCNEGTKLNVFDNIFSDIGDEQSIEQSLSTFSSHLTNISRIIDKFTYNSLVLLDEVGSGTDPKEGASLAIAIIDYLTKKGGRVITTTHYSDLKAFAYDNPRIINASVEFQVETLKPTYKLQIGVASALINKIDEENEKISAIKQDYIHKINEYNQKLAELNKSRHEIEANYDNIVAKAKKEASLILDEAKSKSEEILKELNKLKDDKYFEEHKLASLKHDVRNLSVNDKEEKLFNDKINVGDLVYIKSYQTTGEVKKIKNDKYEVQCGRFTMTFNLNEISLESHQVTKPKKEVKKKSTTLVTKTSSAKMTLDLRGYRYEEVASALDKFIDDAYLANMPLVYVIHGFGTGAVRDAVYKYLKKSSYVKSYRFGGEGEGLNGCTVVYLK